MKKYFMLVMLAIVGLASCEKPLASSEEQLVDDADANLVISVSRLEQIPFETVRTRAAQDVASVCGRLNFVLYQNGEKVKAVTQVAGDDEFGKIGVSVTPGSYQLLVLAHSGEGNPSLTNPEKITFGSGIGMTDIFWHYADITVSEEQTAHAVELKRAVAMFRLKSTDNVPASVKRIIFQYTGGSMTFNALTGWGATNSNQTSDVDVTEEMVGKPGVFEVYTFPQPDKNVKFLVKAVDENEDIRFERTFADVKMERNKITQYTGPFFDPSSQNLLESYSFSVEPEWSGVIDY